MGIQSFQAFIEANCPNACVPVDLLKIAGTMIGYGLRRPTNARNIKPPGPLPNPGNKLCLVVDGECCLDRLYGGYFSDWVCGGEWNRMVQFLAVLTQTIQHNNIELAIFFNGSLEQQRMEDWMKTQLNERKKVAQVMKHLNTKGTPPPKVWWVPPVCLTTCLRMALRHLNVSVYCTMDDHRQEVIAFCRENKFHGLMAEDAEYAIFDPPRYFSSEQLKLTYKGSLETKEFILDEVAKGLDLHPNRFCVFASLLGNFLLTEADLADFHKSLNTNPKEPFPPEALIKAVSSYVRSLQTLDNLDAVGQQIFGGGTYKADECIQKFKQCVQYYLNGTKEGFLRYQPSSTGHKQGPNMMMNSGYNMPMRQEIPQFQVDSSKFASETDESELSSLTAYHQARIPYTSQPPQIVINEPQNQLASELKHRRTDDAILNGTEDYDGQGDAGASKSIQGKQMPSSPSGGYPHPVATPLPSVPPEVLRTASERHQKGLMSPWIYQLLTQGEIKIPICLEEEVPKDLPLSYSFYRPARQFIYAILFNVHHAQFVAKQKAEQNKDGRVDMPRDVIIKEWIPIKAAKGPDQVKAVQLGWAVPTVQRLWFGSNLDDKKRRLRAFLTCMRSDTPLLLNTYCVPQHFLVLCCVLRYMMTSPEHRILRKQELDAFLAQAVSPQLMQANVTQAMQLSRISARGAQLASLFNKGVEVALLANDACGAPIPWLMCCPWLFFDGKLFHQKLLSANTAKNLCELCDGQLDQVARVERMRQAVLEGFNVEFARPPLQVLAAAGRIPGYPVPQHGGSALLPTPHSTALMGRGRGRSLMDSFADRRPLLATGGQLEVAGVVVGSWGPNYGMGTRGRGMMNSASVGGGGGMRRYSGAGGGRNYSGNNQVRKTNVSKAKKVTVNPNKSNNEAKRKSKRRGTNEETTNGIGRGCTIEPPTETITVNQLMRKEPSPEATSGATAAQEISTNGTVVNGQFEDETPTTTKTPTILKKIGSTSSEDALPAAQEETTPTIATE